MDKSAGRPAAGRRKGIVMAESGTRHEVVVPEATSLDGLPFRRLTGPEDYPGLVEVFTACAATDDIGQTMTVSDMATFIENPVGFDPAADFLLAEAGQRVIGYMWTTHRVEASGEVIHSHRGYVDPGWRRKGIGAAFLAEARRRAHASTVGDGVDGRHYLQTYLLGSETAAHELLQRFGYAAIRYAFNMARDLSQPIPDLPLPAGLEVRPARQEHYRAIWDAEREAFRDHWGYAPWPEEGFTRFLNFPHYDPSLWRVAWAGDEVAGSVLNYINVPENDALGRRRGYTEDISVRRPWRRRGLASSLITRSLQALHERGMDQAALSVDAENQTGALDLYTRLGYVVGETWTLYRKPLIPEVPETDGPGE
jgi:mycothiol synthase